MPCIEETAMVKVEKSTACHILYVYCSSDGCFLSIWSHSEKSYNKDEISFKGNVFQVKRFEVLKENDSI